MAGVLEPRGLGKPLPRRDGRPLAELWQSREKRNKALVRSLYADTSAEWLLQHTREEAALGRMAEPIVVDDCSKVEALLQPRFAVEQQREDGSMKFRAIDHFSWGDHGDGLVDSVNGFLVPGEKLKHDTLDSLCAGMRYFVSRVNVIPELYKGDVRSAFRRVPIREDHRWLCGIVFVVGGKVCVAWSCRHCL